MNEWKNLADLVSFTVELLARTVAHVTVLAFWVLCQWALGYILRLLELPELERWVLAILQVVFAGATVLPIGFFIYVDTRKMVIRGKTIIRRYEARFNKK